MSFPSIPFVLTFASIEVYTHYTYYSTIGFDWAGYLQPDPNFEIWMSHISGCEIDKLPPFESGEPIMAQACDDIVVGNQRWDLTPLMNLSPMKAADVSLTNLFTFSICKPLMNACPNTIEPDDMSCNVTGVAAMCHTWRDILGNQASTCGGRSQIVTYSDFNYMGASSYRMLLGHPITTFFKQIFLRSWNRCSVWWR
jgi:hypothetical protein